MDNVLPKSITLDITEEDIALGRRADATCCPIARALKRQLNVSDVEVGCRTAFVRTNESESGRYSLPVRARTFIERFDTWGRGEPQTITLLQDEL